MTPEKASIIMKDSNRAWKQYYTVVGNMKIFLLDN